MGSTDRDLSSTLGLPWATALARVRHHRGMPLDPFSPFDPYGGAPAPDSLTGHLLVATPAVDDPNFWRRVILVLDHGLDGAMGIALDRPGGVAVDAVRSMARWHAMATAPPELFTGGPVSRNSLVGLARLASRPDDSPGGAVPPNGWRTLVDDERPIGTIDLSSDPSAVAGTIVGLRIFSGCAGWAPGQLEDELDEGSWYVVPAEARDAISADPEGLWRRVLKRQGGALALVAAFPADPTSN